jgi:hypothetical protein
VTVVKRAVARQLFELHCGAALRRKRNPYRGHVAACQTPAMKPDLGGDVAETRPYDRYDPFDRGRFPSG